MDYKHPDLKSNIFVNEEELHGTPGVDDDGNGEVDDIYGANMISRSNNPQDDQSHGTHVAGTIGAHGNNGMGVTGVAWRPKIVPCKFIGASGAVRPSSHNPTVFGRRPSRLRTSLVLRFSR